MAVTHEQIVLLQEQLTASKAAVQTMQATLELTTGHSEKIAAALDALRAESSHAVAELRDKLEQARKDENSFKKSLVDLKSNEPKELAGLDSEDVKARAKEGRGEAQQPDAEGAALPVQRP